MHSTESAWCLPLITTPLASVNQIRSERTRKPARPRWERQLCPDIEPGNWHNVRNVLTGNIIQVYIDNQLVLTFKVAGVPALFGPITAGTVAFGNEQGAEGRFRNLVVTDPSHNVLYQSSLTDSSILDQHLDLPLLPLHRR